MVYYDVCAKIGPRDQKYKIINKEKRYWYCCTGKEVLYDLELENGEKVTITKHMFMWMQKRNFLKKYHKALEKRLKKLKKYADKKDGKRA